MKIVLIVFFTLFSVSLQAVSIGELFDAIRKQPSTKIDEISSKMAEIAQKRVNAGYYPKVDLFASYSHYNTASSLRPLDPSVTGSLIAKDEPIGFANTIQKIGVSATIPVFVKELGTLSQRAKYLAKSANLKKRLNFYQNEALILGSNATLEYLDNLLVSLKATQRSLVRTKKDIEIAVNSGRTAAIAIDKMDERLNQIDISINSIEIKRATLVSNIENLTGIEIEKAAKMELSSNIKEDEFFALLPLQELIKASMSDYKATKEKRYYPKVALNLMWSENYAQRDTSTGESENLGYGYYQLGFSMPLYNRGEDVDMQLKKIAIMKDRMKLKKSEQELKSEAKALQKSLILLEKSKKLKKLNIKKRENLLKYAKVAYAQGSMTEEDYLLYEDGVLSAKSSYYETLSQTWQDIAKLAVIYGNDLKEVVR